MVFLGMRLKKKGGSTRSPISLQTPFHGDRNSTSYFSSPSTNTGISMISETDNFKLGSPAESRWKIFQTFKQKTDSSTPDSDTDVSIIDDWNNEKDDVTLLPQRKTMFVETGQDGDEGFYVKSSTRPEKMMSTAHSIPKQSMTHVPCTSTRSMSQKIWNRVSSLKTVKNIGVREPSTLCHGKDKRKNEIEIQFECFLEDTFSDADDYNNFSSSPSPQRLSNVTPCRNSVGFQPWFSQKLELVKLRSTPCFNKKKNIRLSPPCGTNGTEINDYLDDGWQSQILFEKATGTSSKDDERISSESDVRSWDFEPPIQFNVPIDILQSSIYHEQCFNRETIDHKLKSVILDIV